MFVQTPLKKVNSKSGELIMATEAQILANCPLASVFCCLSTVNYQLFSFLYICRESSTNPPFLCKTNPILIKAKINLTLYIKEIYGNFTPLRTMKNKPNSNPKQTQSNPISERVKLMQSVYLQGIMKKNAAD